jgi:hypothetical protein
MLLTLLLLLAPVLLQQLLLPVLRIHSWVLCLCTRGAQAHAHTHTLLRTQLRVHPAAHTKTQNTAGLCTQLRPCV